uniref:UDP-D-xylose:beta-D-glucoside alpha-1,3-D-xylosyltransferase n=1 Tax=Romanomermis culicivorax TaxID=13658 RepID=A0A915L8A0_ROMCU
MDKNLKFCIDLLTRKRQNVQPPLSANLDRVPWCPMIYDGVLCWPATEANQTATLPCPTRSERATDFVFKTCGHRGQWAGRNPTESYGQYGYTDYSLCGPGVYSSYSAVSIPSADEDISFSIYENPSLWRTTSTSSAAILKSSSQSATWSSTTYEQAETVSSRSFLTKSLLSTATSLVFSKGQTLSNSTSAVAKDHDHHSIAAAHYYLTMYNMKNVQWAGLVASLIAIFLLVTALTISRSTLKNRLQNSILVALLVIGELSKCCICIWIAVECTYQVFRILTRNYIMDELSFCYFAVPLYKYLNSPLFCDLLLTWFVWTFTTCFIFLPFFNEPCTVPNASTAGSVTCLFFYFFGFFVSLFYAISQIVSPWSDYVIVYDRDNGLKLADLTKQPVEKLPANYNHYYHVYSPSESTNQQGNQISKPLSNRNSTDLSFHIFADDAAKRVLANEISKWKSAIPWKPFRVQFYSLKFPRKNQNSWINLFRQCASQRLFIPNILTNIDSLIYIDTDIIFLRPIEDLWHYFTLFNDMQISGLVAESEDLSTNWYNRFAKHPYVEPLGINSGVMLMNLTKMRKFNWNSRVEWTFNRYKALITWGDQDLINVIFSQYKDRLFMMGCEWNYRPDHCIYSPACHSASVNGISVIHGNRDYFHSTKKTPFKILYQVTKECK